MNDLARLVGEFATILAERRGSDLDGWMKQVREAGLTELDPFLRGLDQDHGAAIAGLTVSFSNGPIECVNTKADQATNVWPGQLRATPTPHPAGITVTTGIEPPRHHRKCDRAVYWTDPGESTLPWLWVGGSRSFRCGSAGFGADLVDGVFGDVVDDVLA